MKVEENKIVNANKELNINEIYNMDCLEGLKLIPDNSIDIIITSPPYNKAGYEGFIRKNHKSDTWNRRNVSYGGKAENDFMVESEYQEWQINILNELHRILKEDGSVFYNHKIRIAQHKASHPLEWILKSNLNFRQQIIWDRGSTPTLAPIRYLPTTELIFWLTKSAIQPSFKRDKTSTMKGEVWRINPNKDATHPASYPIEIVDNILMHIPNENGDKVVLDCFMGSGTTAVSSVKNGFNYLGLELNAEYVKLAKDRITKQIETKE